MAQLLALPRKKKNSSDYLDGINDFTSQEELFQEKTGKTFTDLYNKYYDKLYYHVSRFITNDELKAQDITTDSFLRAFNRIETYDKTKGAFSTWLYTISYSLIVKDSKTANVTLSMDKPEDNTGTTLMDYLSETIDDENDDSERELLKLKYNIMMESIDKLKPTYKEVIVMYDFQDMSYQEITDALGLNLSTTKSRIRSARIKLMEMTMDKYTKLNKIYRK